MSHSFTYSILIHYSEIALKLNNRSYFEKKFINNIKQHINSLKYSKINLIAARVFIHNINIKDWDIYKDCLKNVMGLQSATLMIKTNSDINEFKQASCELIKNLNFKSFRISTKRQYKQFKHTSNQVNVQIGEYVQLLSKKPVSLNYYEVNIIIEILRDNSYVGFDKIKGFSGLPTRCQENTISLISSGIDSPVASFEMIKRGAKIDFVHFHSAPAINKQSIENVKKILNVLTEYQLKSTLYLIPLLKIQQKIMQKIPDKYWVIFFRRYMIKIANKLAQQNNAVALITGDSVGQVASQTLSNLRSVSDASKLPILRPLSGMNKEDIINRAKEIRTYELSILPYEDCCSFFVPPHPETKAKMENIKQLNKKLNLDYLINDAIKNMEVTKFKFGEK
tara:strand:- start:5637 stop:6818 length:1182 start_codon:yes stop_codon:yes gene_type:complete